MAQQNSTQHEPSAFVQPLALSRGTLLPAAPDASYLSGADARAFARSKLGWAASTSSRIESIVFGNFREADRLIVEKPVTIGHVGLGDWNDAEKSGVIDAIWLKAVRSAKERGDALNMPISAERWVAYPTLNRAKSYMYYAIQLDRAGQRTVSITATLFDRQGYVTFRLSSAAGHLDSNAIRALVEDCIGAYRPDVRQGYADIAAGDRRASGGALDVLAAMADMQYVSSHTSTALYLLFAILEKLWFIPLLPLAGLLRYWTPKTT